MARTKLDLRGDAYRKVLGFLMGHWAHQPGRVLAMFALFMLATVADVLTPLFAGNLVTAVSNNVNADGALNAALWAFGLLIALGLGSVVVRQFAFMVLIQFTLKIMADIAQSAFHRVQRFSTDWHANTFAGSTVRKVTRGMWGVDMLNDTLIIMLFPSLAMLVGTSILLGVIWPLMGLVISIGSLIYVVLTVVLSVGYVSPAATLANAWDTRMGGALADAISCNAVVKGFGVDPATALLAKARKRPELSRATLLEGGVENIPLEDRIADYTLSLLVLQEFPDRRAALAEMRRITRPGGVVAACQWDFARMPVIDALVTAIDSVRPSAARSIAANSPQAFTDEHELQSCWKGAGLVEVENDRIVVERVFDTFEDLWRPLLAGSTPSTLTLAALSPPDQLEVRSRMEATLRYAGQPLKLAAEAMAVKGRS